MMEMNHNFQCFLSQVLKVFPYPVTVTVVQFAVGTVLVILMWAFNLYKRPKISGAQVLDLSQNSSETAVDGSLVIDLHKVEAYCDNFFDSLLQLCHWQWFTL